MLASTFFERESLLKAQDLLKGKIHRTPVLSSQSLNQHLQAEIYFKCENLQKIGAFKFRGAMYALSCLSPEELQKGVLTHSSGNHAQALALAAKIYGIPAWIVMPETAPAVKLAAVKAYGANVVLCPPTLAARESTAARIQAETGACFIHPFNDPRIIAGQATAAMELIEEHPDLDILMAPVGGGGLLSGTALAQRHFASGMVVWAAEPAGADDAYRSLQTGQIQESIQPDTIADGLLTSLGSWTFPIIQQHVEEILLVSDEMIIQAMRWMWERMKLVVEPSGAVPLAAVLQYREKFTQKRVGLIVSGGNVDLSKMSDYFT